jgi:hypothetical protein
VPGVLDDPRHVQAREGVDRGVADLLAVENALGHLDGVDDEHKRAARHLSLLGRVEPDGQHLFDGEPIQPPAPKDSSGRRS